MHRAVLPHCYSILTGTLCAAATARVFSMKIGVLPDRVLMSLINDRMIAKGTILDFITAFFKDYLATDSMDDLVQLLRKARLDDRLLDFFPPQKRNLTDFDAHFKASVQHSVGDKSHMSTVVVPVQDASHL